MTYNYPSTATVIYHKDLSMIQYIWRGHVSSSEYRKALDKILRIARKEKATYWLSDQTHATTLDLTDQHWTTDVWMPKIFKTQLRKLAILLPHDIYNNMVLEDFIQQAEGRCPFEIQFFSDAESAIEWFHEPVPVQLPLPLYAYA